MKNILTGMMLGGFLATIITQQQVSSGLTKRFEARIEENNRECVQACDVACARMILKVGNEVKDRFVEQVKQ